MGGQGRRCQLPAAGEDGGWGAEGAWAPGKENSRGVSTFVGREKVGEWDNHREGEETRVGAGRESREVGSLCLHEQQQLRHGAGWKA